VAEKLTVFAALTDLYRRIDEKLAPKLADQPISCKKGCAHCCLLFTAVSTADALQIAQTVLNWPDWREWVPKLVRAAQAHCFKGVGNNTYLAKKLRCVFLREDNTCGIYAVRPAPCRFHLVVSKPELCDPNNGRAITTRLDLKQAESVIWEFSFELDQKLFQSKDPVLAPLPIMVLFGMLALLKDKGPAFEFLSEQTKNIPSPKDYFKKYILPKLKRRMEQPAP
jgi:Fe-S-cluster containining protein